MLGTVLRRRRSALTWVQSGVGSLGSQLPAPGGALDLAPPRPGTGLGLQEGEGLLFSDHGRQDLAMHGSSFLLFP